MVFESFWKTIKVSGKPLTFTNTSLPPVVFPPTANLAIIVCLLSIWTCWWSTLAWFFLPPSAAIFMASSQVFKCSTMALYIKASLHPGQLNYKISKKSLTLLCISTGTDLSRHWGQLHLPFRICSPTHALQNKTQQLILAHCLPSRTTSLHNLHTKWCRIGVSGVGLKSPSVIMPSIKLFYLTRRICFLKVRKVIIKETAWFWISAINRFLITYLGCIIIKNHFLSSFFSNKWHDIG